MVTHEVPITSDNAMEIIAPYDYVINGADNFAARYLVNDACHFLKKPLVDGSILLFDGQVTVYLPGKGCYRCLYPAPPPPGMVPSCAEAGVLGALCGTVGTIQATEVLKLILGVGDSLHGRLLLYDALAMEFRQVRIRRDPHCVALRRRADRHRAHRLRRVLRRRLRPHERGGAEGRGRREGARSRAQRRRNVGAKLLRPV